MICFAYSNCFHHLLFSSSSRKTSRILSHFLITLMAFLNLEFISLAIIISTQIKPLRQPSCTFCSVLRVCTHGFIMFLHVFERHRSWKRKDRFFPRCSEILFQLPSSQVDTLSWCLLRDLSTLGKQF